MIKREENVYELEIRDLKKLFEQREVDSHKGMFGTVGIMGGSLEYSGAVKLANMSAASIRSGCGVVRVIVPENIVNAIVPYLLEQTLYPVSCDQDNFMNFKENELELAVQNLKAVAVGMGWGRSKSYQDILYSLLKNYSGSLIIDADGLNTLATMDKEKLKNTRAKVILTPHLKEFSRLTLLSIDKIKKDPMKLAINFAKEYQVILLLKGSTTIVTDGNVTYLSRSGCPGMATAGSGDVLSGILVGMLGYLPSSSFVVAASAYLAGVASKLAQVKYTDISMKASDTIEFIPSAIKKIRDSK